MRGDGLRLHGLAFDHPDYPAAAARCRGLIWDNAVQVLHTGSPVVLDWNQWSRSGRAEWVARASVVGVPCILHHIRVPIEVAISQAAARTDPASHTLTADGVRHLAALFEPPTTSEGFTLHEVSGSAGSSG